MHVYCIYEVIRVIKPRRVRWVGNVERMGESRGAYGVSVGKRKGKTRLEKSRHRCEDNIQMRLKNKMWTWTGLN